MTTETPVQADMETSDLYYQRRVDELEALSSAERTQDLIDGSLKVTDIRWTMELLPKRQTIRDLILTSSDDDVVKVLAMRAYDAEQLAESWRAIAQLALSRLYVGERECQKASDQVLHANRRLKEAGMNYQSTELLTLRDGKTVSVTALRLALKLEESGISLRLEDDELYLNPGSKVLPADLPLIRAYREDLKIIAACSESRA